jgi:GTP cyclohydrolase II
MKAVRANRLGGPGAGNERAVTVDTTNSQAPAEVARLPIATTSGEFDLRAFELASGYVYLALVKGEIGHGPPVLTRLHSECLTGDALDSLRCDCGIQLRMGLRTIAAEGRGVLLYATGQEGRGIGLVNKLRSYMLQDEGADTVEANALLGLPIDRRDYSDAAAVLSMLGVKSVRLLTNNPSKAAGLRASGLDVAEIVPIISSPHLRNIEYLRTKRRRLGHVSPPVPNHNGVTEIAEIDSVLGNGGPRADRPRVVLKFAQTLDGRIASRGGDSKWISGEPERTLSHALRAGCDAVMVGVGTVATDNPRLTVRLVPGASPLRVVLDSTLRIPDNAHVLDESAGTIILTTNRASLDRTESLLQRGVAVREIEEGTDGVDIKAALQTLREEGIESLLVEGGSRVITSFLAARMVDRVVVAIAPSILGSGTEAVGDLQFRTLRDALRLEDPSTYRVGEDLVVAGDL